MYFKISAAVCGRYGASARGAKPEANKIETSFDSDGGEPVTSRVATKLAPLDADAPATQHTCCNNMPASAAHKY